MLSPDLLTDSYQRIAGESGFQLRFFLTKKRGSVQRSGHHVIYIYICIYNIICLFIGKDVFSAPQQRCMIVLDDSYHAANFPHHTDPPGSQRGGTPGPEYLGDLRWGRFYVNRDLVSRTSGRYESQSRKTHRNTKTERLHSAFLGTTTANIALRICCRVIQVVSSSDCTLYVGSWCLAFIFIYLD